MLSARRLSRLLLAGAFLYLSIYLPRMCIHAQAALGPTGRAQDSTSEKPRVSFFSAAGFYGEERAGFYGEEG